MRVPRSVSAHGRCIRNPAGKHRKCIRKKFLKKVLTRLNGFDKIAKLAPGTGAERAGEKAGRYAP